QAPQVGTEATRILRGFDFDREPTEIVLPSGRTISFNYAQNGELSSVQDPSDTTTYAYDATTRQLASITSANGVVIEYLRDGPLVTRVKYSGLIEGRVDL